MTKREVPEPPKSMAPATVEGADRRAESSAESTDPQQVRSDHQSQIDRVKRLLEQNRRILGSSASNLSRVASSEPPGDEKEAEQLMDKAGDAAETASAAAELDPLPQQPDLLPIQVPDAGFNAASLAIAQPANQRRRTPPTSPSAQSIGSKHVDFDVDFAVPVKLTAVSEFGHLLGIPAKLTPVTPMQTDRGQTEQEMTSDKILAPGQRQYPGAGNGR
jgi:hypothetical protein